MKSHLTSLALFTSLIAATTSAHDHGTHQHGVATLEVAVEGSHLSIHFESPLDNIVGFEHAPRTAAEKEKAKAALDRLKQGTGLFAPTPAAGCKLAEAKVEAPVLEGGKEAGGHADLDADYRFDCAAPGKLKGVDAQLFAAFPGLKRLNAAVVSAKGQQAFTLTRPLHYMNW